MVENYLDSTRKQFEYYKTIAEKAMAQVDDEGFFWQYNAESNSIAIIVKHLWGNMMSRFTDFLTSDGEKEWRERDEEFEWRKESREDLMKKWEEGWAKVFEALDSVNHDNFATTIYIRNMGHTVLEAMNRQTNHYAYHIGQIIYLARMLKANDWASLSIPKGKSVEFNQQKFSQPKHKGHFSDDYLKKNDE
ncbi:MAG: DUF1572 domain-containing protein [Bacteroidia bacterium]|nr:DUF1572 domain-containing protein [Bacteroidia bacterium]